MLQQSAGHEVADGDDHADGRQEPAPPGQGREGFQRRRHVVDPRPPAGQCHQPVETGAAAVDVASAQPAPDGQHLRATQQCVAVGVDPAD